MSSSVFLIKQDEALLIKKPKTRRDQKSFLNLIFKIVRLEDKGTRVFC